MAKNIYRTAAGQGVNIDTLRLVNDSVVTVGNMPVNARGDEVRPDGTIIRTRNEIMKDHYRNIEPVVKYSPNKRRPTEETQAVADVEEEAPKAAVITMQVPETDSTLRGSLASTVTIDLLQDPTQPKRTIRRI